MPTIADFVPRPNSSVDSNLPPSLKTIEKGSSLLHPLKSADEHLRESAEELERRYIDSQRGTF